MARIRKVKPQRQDGEEAKSPVTLQAGDLSAPTGAEGSYDNDRVPRKCPSPAASQFFVSTSGTDPNLLFQQKNLATLRQGETELHEAALRKSQEGLMAASTRITAGPLRSHNISIEDTGKDITLQVNSRYQLEQQRQRSGYSRRSFGNSSQGISFNMAE